MNVGILKVGILIVTPTLILIKRRAVNGSQNLKLEI